MGNLKNNISVLLNGKRNVIVARRSGATKNSDDSSRTPIATDFTSVRNCGDTQGYACTEEQEPSQIKRIL